MAIVYLMVTAIFFGSTGELNGTEKTFTLAFTTLDECFETIKFWNNAEPKELGMKVTHVGDCHVVPAKPTTGQAI